MSDSDADRLKSEADRLFEEYRKSFDAAERAFEEANRILRRANDQQQKVKLPEGVQRIRVRANTVGQRFRVAWKLLTRGSVVLDIQIKRKEQDAK